ncbi:MAG TPA: type II toxin-antitoxin system RelE/ParE family toxin [Candidatus Sulfotelmatobacter sp.]|nr:type II toxin-antitoxin system RelE/ParE family toxin [Candidatus Sulfotelmatobacter sp.]
MTGKMTGPTIEWTEQALRQLDQAHDYIALSNSEEVAERITTLIVTTIQQLAAFPMSGRPGRVPGTRELVISNTPFIAAYAIAHDRIVILAIYHGAQQWPEAF